MDKIIKINNLDVVIKKKKILKDVEFQVKKGEIIGLVGPNGAGKTTLLKAIAGLIKVDEKKVWIENEDLSKDYTIKEKIGSLIEYPQFYEEFTGRDNLKLLSSLTDKKVNVFSKFNTATLQEILKVLNLEEYIDKKVKSYSLGTKQKLAIAHSMIHNPSILILDEPMNGLDPVIVKKLRMHLNYLSKEKNVTILISSHILSELEMLCNNYIFVNKGKIIDQSIVEEKINENYYEFVFDSSIENIANFLNKDLKHMKKIGENTLIGSIQNKNLNDILDRFIKNNIQIVEVKKYLGDLEDKFVYLTEDNKFD